jgi:hypothetical protein
MKDKRFFAGAALAVALMTATTFTSCNNDDEIGNSAERSGVALQVSAGFAEITTRVTGASFDASDAIGIFQLQNGTSTVWDANKQYVTTGGATATFTPATDVIYFPANTTPASDFVAYYPYSAGQSSLTCPVNVTDQSNQEAIDLLTADKATGKDKNSPAVAFVFRHRLSKITLNITAGTGITDTDLANITAVTITGQQVTGSFNLADNTLTPATATPQAITLKKAADGKSAAAIILPAAASSGRQLTFTISAFGTFTYDIPAAKTFVSTEETVFNITVTRTGLTITSTIQDWANGGTITGDAE